MTHRRIIFSNSTEMLIDESRLTALKSKVDSIASDLQTLADQSESERREDDATRSSVLQGFDDIARGNP